MYKLYENTVWRLLVLMWSEKKKRSFVGVIFTKDWVCFARNGMKFGWWLLRPACSTLWRVIHVMESLQSPLQFRLVLTSHESASWGWCCPRRPLRTWRSPQSPQTHTWTRWWPCRGWRPRSNHQSPQDSPCCTQERWSVEENWHGVNLGLQCGYTHGSFFVSSRSDHGALTVRENVWPENN